MTLLPSENPLPLAAGVALAFALAWRHYSRTVAKHVAALEALSKRVEQLAPELRSEPSDGGLQAPIQREAPVRRTPSAFSPTILPAEGGRVSASEQQTAALCVVVFGAINMDVKATAEVSTWPEHDVSCKGRFEQSAGGKGANEAVALARLGVPVSLVGRVGDDESGSFLLSALRSERVDVGGTLRLGRTGTAVHIVTKDDSRKFNVTCLEANGELDRTDVQRAVALVRQKESGERRVVVLLQLEVSPVLSRQLVKKVGERCLVALKPSPLASDESKRQARLLLDERVDLCFVAESEALQLLDDEGGEETLICTLSQAERAAEAMLRRWPRLQTVVVTFAAGHLLCENSSSGGWLGAGPPDETPHARGSPSLVRRRVESLAGSSPPARRRMESLAESASAPVRQPPSAVQPLVIPRSKCSVVDVIGAADAFIGGFLAAQAAGKASGESLLWALASGTRSTLASGARKAVPHSADELLEFLCGDDQLYDAGACGCKVAEKEHASAAITVLPGDAKADPFHLHLAALRADLHAVWDMLPSSSDAAAPANEPAPGSHGSAVSRLLCALQQKDSFGLTPAQRAHQAWQLCPQQQQRHKRAFLACLRQLVAAQLLLAPSRALIEEVASLRPEVSLRPRPPSRCSNSDGAASRDGREAEAGSTAAALERLGAALELPLVSRHAMSEGSWAAGRAPLSPRRSVSLGEKSQREPFALPPSEAPPNGAGGNAAGADRSASRGSSGAVAEARSALPARRALSRADPPAAPPPSLELDPNEVAAQMVLSILLLLSPPAAEFGPLVVHHHSSQRQHGSAGLLPPAAPPVFDAEERSAMFRLLARLLCPLLERRGRAGDALCAALLRARDGEDASLLLCAASAGADAIVRSLLLLFEREGTRAEVELRDRAGRGALQRACEAGPSREHFEGIGLLLRHGLPLESSWLSRAPFEGHEWLAAVTDLNRLYTGDTNIPGTVDGRYCVRGSTCSEYVKFAFDTDDSRNVVLKFFEAREPWELEARVLVGLSRIFERGQTHSDGEGGGDSLHAAPRLLERIDLSGPRSFTPLPYVLVLEEGNRAPLVATQDSELERVAVVSRLLRCVRLLHEAVELEDDLYAPTPRSVERAAASETDEAAGRSIAVHCDLKPSHFLRVGRHYGWRLIDFGSVRREGAEVRSLEYTRAYCAPEVAEAEASGRPLVVTRAIDVWALGLIVYEIFAAEPLLRGCFSPRAQREGATGAAADEAVHAESLPFSNEEWKEYVAWLASGGAAAMIAKLEANEKQLPEALLHMLRRMLKKAPEQRPTLADLLRLSYLKPGVATVKRQQKTLLGLFCCPSKGRQRLDLERDMRTVLRALPVGEREIRAAAQFPTDLLGPLRGDARNEPIRPRVLHFSCHGTPDGRLLMEDSEGRAFTVSTRELVCTLEECLQLQDGIECIFLNLCSSHHIGEDIHAGFPHLYVVAWRTVVQDRVAQAFAREFYTYLGVESSKGNRGSVAEAYAAAERDFHAKYREGDPTVYDEAGNRTGKKDSSVHGVPMLLRPVGWS